MHPLSHSKAGHRMVPGFFYGRKYLEIRIPLSILAFSWRL